MGIAMGFMAAKHLFTASAIGLFDETPCWMGRQPVDELAVKCAVPYRTLRISVDAMASLGLLERGGLLSEQRGCRNLSPAVAREVDLRPMLRFWDRISYPLWVNFERCGAFGLGAAPIQSFQ